MFEMSEKAQRALREAHACELRIARLHAERTHALARYLDECTTVPDYATQNDPGGHVGQSDRGDPWAAEPGEFAADDVAAWMTWTRYRADTVVADAVRLRDALPRTLALLGAGQIDYPRAQVVLRAAAVLDDDDARRVDTALAPLIPTLTTGQLRPVADREVLAVDPDAADRRHTRATADRYLTTRPAGDGIATLTAVGPATTILARREQLRATATTLRRHPDEHRTLTALEFDLLMGEQPARAGDGPQDHARPADPGGGPGEPAGSGGPQHTAATDGAAGAANIRPTAPGRLPAIINVTVSLPTLLGLDDDPADLRGYGAIPATIARDLATHPDSTLRRLIVDPATGALLGVDGHKPLTPTAGAAVVPGPPLSSPGSACDTRRLSPPEPRHPSDDAGTAATPPDPGRGVPEQRKRGLQADRDDRPVPSPQASSPPRPRTPKPATATAPIRGTATPATPPPPPPLTPATPAKPATPVTATATPATPVTATGTPGTSASETPAATPAGTAPPGSTRPSPIEDACPATAAAGYRPPAWMARYVTARDTTCTAPGCRMPSHRSDLDHITPWPTGPTCPCNLQPLCRHHHRMKHTPGWSVSRSDGTTTWTTPTGLVVTVPTPPALPRPLTTARPARPPWPPPSAPASDDQDDQVTTERALRKQVHPDEPPPPDPFADDPPF